MSNSFSLITEYNSQSPQKVFLSYTNKRIKNVNLKLSICLTEQCRKKLFHNQSKVAVLSWPCDPIKQNKNTIHIQLFPINNYIQVYQLFDMHPEYTGPSHTKPGQHANLYIPVKDIVIAARDYYYYL